MQSIFVQNGTKLRMQSGYNASYDFHSNLQVA